MAKTRTILARHHKATDPNDNLIALDFCEGDRALYVRSYNADQTLEMAAAIWEWTGYGNVPTLATKIR